MPALTSLLLSCSTITLALYCTMVLYKLPPYISHTAIASKKNHSALNTLNTLNETLIPLWRVLEFPYFIGLGKLCLGLHYAGFAHYLLLLVRVRGDLRVQTVTPVVEKVGAILYDEKDKNGMIILWIERVRMELAQKARHAMQTRTNLLVKL